MTNPSPLRCGDNVTNDKVSLIVIGLFVIFNLSFKPIAHSAHCHDAFRFRRILFDLFAQPADMHIHRARIAGIVVAPHLLQ